MIKNVSIFCIILKMIVYLHIISQHLDESVNIELCFALYARVRTLYYH